MYSHAQDLLNLTKIRTDPDPRTENWLGVSNPLVIFSILTLYLYFCKSLGPRLMQNRKPFELKTVLKLYNLCQVCYNLFLVHEGAAYIFHKDYDITCETIDYSDNPRALRIAAASWYYYAGKISELLDTVLFVLRKKYNQVSFLHVYHHTVMSIAVWCGVKYYAGGHLILMAWLNCVVHVIMYTYYLISAFGPKYQKYVWWKRHLTKLQLIQFCIVFVHNFAVIFYKCDYPKIFNVACCANTLAFIYMFGIFYTENYKKTDSQITAKDNISQYNFRRKISEKTQ